MLTTQNASEDMEQQVLSVIGGRNAEWYSHFEGSWQFLTQLNILLLNDMIIYLENPKH